MRATKSANTIKEAWIRFTDTGVLAPNFDIRPEIAESWLRCYKAGVDPMQGWGHDILANKELQALRREKSLLVETAKPIMETLFKCFQGTKFIIVLTTETGRILESIGDASTLRSARNLNFIPGANWSEESVGTNAIGTCLVTGDQLQVSGAEHYCVTHHAWTCSGAPIRCPSGRIIGCLNMSGPREKTHLHTLGMIVAATNAVENHLRKLDAQEKLTAAHEHLTAVLSSTSDGIISVDKNMQITHVNKSAMRIMGRSYETFVGQCAKKIFHDTQILSNVLSMGTASLEEEMILKTPMGTVYCTAEITPIKDKFNGITGAVIVLREIKKVHKLVNQMVGAQARIAFTDIIGNSPQMRKVMKKAKMAAASPSTVLLIGESGTGKEMFARASHDAHMRKNGPFVAINCGAMPRELIQSELFGYSDGAFTGAKRGGRPGKFELASGGTLFLDEIGDMPIDMQVNLLRVLQEKTIVRVGGSEYIPVDVRIIAATNKDLSVEAQRGNFRKDLLYRLNVFKIEIPPLRLRKDDIKPITDYLLDKLSVKLGKKILKVDPGVYELLYDYEWPGNVRELENVLEYAVNLMEGSELLVDHVDDHLQKNSFIKDINVFQTKTLSIKELEKKLIENVLKRNQGNITQTAKDLEIGRTTLYDKLKKYNIITS